MTEAMPFDIDLEESFPHLPAAPIVEAVIHWRARATKEWQPDQLRKSLAERLPEYPQVDLQHYHEVIFESRTEGTETQQSANRRDRWHGVRMASETEPYIAQFTRDGFLFSRLQPYQDWERFSSEARRLWQVFMDVASPSEIERLGVRFINRIRLANFANLSEYLREPPSFNRYLPMSGLLYQSTFDVPGHPIGIRIVKAMQLAAGDATDESGLIIDIDVFTKKQLRCEDQVLDDYLPKMQSLKNKMFFYLLTPQAIETFK